MSKKQDEPAQSKKSLQKIWASVFSSNEPMDAATWQEKVSNFFGNLADMLLDEEIELLDNEAGDMLSLITSYFLIVLPNLTDSLIPVLNSANSKIAQLSSLSIKGTGAIAMLWNKYVASESDSLTSCSYLKKISTFFKKLSELTKLKNLDIKEDEVGQVIAYITFILSLQVPDPFYHVEKMRMEMLNCFKGRRGIDKLKKRLNFEEISQDLDREKTTGLYS